LHGVHKKLLLASEFHSLIILGWKFFVKEKYYFWNKLCKKRENVRRAINVCVANFFMLFLKKMCIRNRKFIAWKKGCLPKKMFPFSSLHGVKKM
jgi:hypothetical protein